MTNVIKVVQSVATFGENPKVEVVVEVGEQLATGIVKQIGRYTINLPPETPTEQYSQKSKELLINSGLCSSDAVLG